MQCMKRDEAIRAAEEWATEYETQFGECLWIFHHPSQPLWVMIFEIEEYQPLWCWLISIGDEGKKEAFLAMRHQEGFWGP